MRFMLLRATALQLPSAFFPIPEDAFKFLSTKYRRIGKVDADYTVNNGRHLCLEHCFSRVGYLFKICISLFVCLFLGIGMPRHSLLSKRLPFVGLLQ